MVATYQQSWERVLLPLAYEAEQQTFTPSACAFIDRSLLDRAYAYCDSIISANSGTFYLATRQLPAAKRRAMRALYAFCRMSDDIVDCWAGDTEEKLALWRRKALRGCV
jgi:15-cis-phytoene synthase